MKHDGAYLPAKEAIQAMVFAYLSRTAGSREAAAQYRAYHADKSSIAFGVSPLTEDLNYPIVVDRAEGARLWDVDGNEYVDVLQGLGANLFGHNPDFVRQAILEQMEKGVPLGVQTERVGRVAELIAQLTGMSRVCFSNTGTEAIMTAIRIARAKTRRSRIALFTDSYHGHSDMVLMRAPVAEYARRKLMARFEGRIWSSPLASLLRLVHNKRSVPASPGIPNSLAREVVVLNYGDPGALKLVKSLGSRLAAVLVEPVQSRRPELQPREFLRSLREVTRSAGCSLIFDEMVSGFRVHPGGAQAVFGIEADLVTYSKILGGALPLSVVAGRYDFMDYLDPRPDSSVRPSETAFFAGTFCKHPLSLAAAEAVLSKLVAAGPSLQTELNQRTADLVTQLNGIASEARVPVVFTHFGSFFSISLKESQISPVQVNLLSYFLLHHGIHLRGGDRGGFLTTAHNDSDIARIVAVFRDGLRWVYGKFTVH